MISANIKERKYKGITRQDFLQMMIEANDNNNRKMSDEEITASAFSFFFGGMDTISSALCFIVNEIATNQNMQKRLQENIDFVLEDCNRETTYNEIIEILYLEATINEGLRLFPPVGFIDQFFTNLP